MSGDIRIGDAEREQAAAALADHYAAGRLEHSEYSERLDAIWTARTRADLDLLFHDLPRLAPPEPPARRRDRRRLPLPLAALLVLLVGALVITHLPLVLLLVAVVVFLKISHHGRAARSGHGHGPARRW